jgi:transposase InsO family protein
VTGTSKQNFHQQLNRWLDQKEEQAALIPLIHQIRKEHPHMSARLIYKRLCPNTMGRDKFEDFCFAHGFKVTCSRNYRRTTDSSGVERFPNLIEGRELTGVNRVFVSDITYYEMNKEFYYITLIMDLYTREVVGYNKSKSLRTAETTIPAIKMMARNIGSDELEGAIIHSDGGGQFYCKEFLVLTQKFKMNNSMAKLVYDNSHSERLNGIIKNDYLIPYGPQNDAQLGLCLTKAIRNYNNGKPHGSLGGMTPVEFRNSNCNKPMFIKKITTTVEIENNSPSYFPTSTVQHHHQYV